MRELVQDTRAHIQRQSDRSFFTPTVHQGIASSLSTAKGGGQVLPARARGEMETSFGRDFGNVRIHTDERAAEMNQDLNAHAFTHGNDIYFNEGRFSPDSGDGKRILAHELTHVVQQQQAGPAVQCLRITGGGFGKSLEEFTNIHNVEDKTVRILMNSPAFMRIARTLDQHFESRTVSSAWESKNSTMLEYDASHRVTNKSAPFQGKFELMVVWDSDGASFEPYAAPSNPLSADLINLNATSKEEFIRQIVHESIHALHHATGAGGVAPATLADAIIAGVKEEVDVRKEEEKIMDPIAKKHPKTDFGVTGSTDPEVVKREYSPGLGMTYIESIWWSWKMKEAQTADGITDERAREILEKVKKDPTEWIWRDHKPNDIMRLSEYALAAENYLKTRKEWAELMDKKGNSPDLPALQDAMLKDHAKRFFEGRITI